MTIITKRDMKREKITNGFGLGDDYSNVIESVIKIIASEKEFKNIDLKTAIELCMLDFKVENASFHDILKPFYNENYDLIPTLGIDGLMDLAVEEHISKWIVDDAIVDAIGKAIAYDYMVKITKDDEKYSYGLLDFVKNIVPNAYYDLQEMYDDIKLGAEINKQTKCSCKNCKCSKKKMSSAPQVQVLILDDSGMANDIIALLNLLNGGK